MARWTSRLTSVRFEDALGAGLTIGPGPGDLNIGEVNAENAEHIKKLDRGKHDGFVLGDDLVQECSITVELENQSLTDAAAARVIDFMKRQNFFSGATSVDPTIWAFKCIVTMQDGATTAVKTLPICEGGFAFAEAKEGHTLAISVRNHGPIVES
jgi:hypothetical protein